MLDPVAERDLYRALSKTLAGRTAVFVTHRLASARWADRIYVLDGGRVAEEGSHGALMEKGGLYAEMYAAQAERYREVAGLYADDSQ